MASTPNTSFCFMVIISWCLSHVTSAGAGVKDVWRSELVRTPELTLALEDNPLAGTNVLLTRGGVREVIAVVGRLSGAAQDRVTQPGEVVAQYSHDTSLRISAAPAGGAGAGGYVVTVGWQAPRDARLEDCVNLGDQNWYGGPQQKRQYWPIEKLTLADYSYVSKEADNCGVAEPYWLSSSGVYYYVDKRVPLFVDQNDLEKNAACFIAQVKPPYTSRRDRNELRYTIGIFADPRLAHQYAVSTHLGKPDGIPDSRMIAQPTWSTWARYKTAVDHQTVMNFAQEIIDHKFNNSQYEIDDLWEICYGSLTVDETRFPDLKNTTDMLKELGFRVTMWVHPFINKGCEPWYSEAKENGYLVKSEYGSVETSWWNDNETTTAYVDFTVEAAREWWTGRLLELRRRYGIDSFKFDAGESSWAPQVPVLAGSPEDQPSILTQRYVEAAAQFGPLVEVRAAAQTQTLPVFIRMIDKDTYWTFENGLPTLITTMMQMNMNGYPLVLPDMIGGNGYNEPPSKELFIRWLQANTFMPAMQFSYVPWDFDNETIEISRQYVTLHAQYAPQIEACMQRAAREGAPVNPPIWWVAPTDRTAHDIADQYMVCDEILVAPVVEKGARARDVYLPSGSWREGLTGARLQGGEWYRDYAAPLDTLLFFIKET